MRMINLLALESQLGEEPLVLAALVAVLEAHSDLEACLLAFNWVLQVLHAVLAVEGHFWHAVTCWHEVIVVDELGDGIEEFVS
jgi:hypothetical protein